MRLFIFRDYIWDLSEMRFVLIECVLPFQAVEQTLTGSKFSSGYGIGWHITFFYIVVVSDVYAQHLHVGDSEDARSLRP